MICSSHFLMKDTGITGFCERRVPEQEDPESRFIRIFDRKIPEHKGCSVKPYGGFWRLQLR